MLGHADRHGSHASQREPGIISTDGVSDRILGVLDQLGEAIIVDDNGTQHDIGVTGNILGAGNDGHVRTQCQWAIDIARAPGVVRGQNQAMGLGDIGNRLHVEHFK